MASRAKRRPPATSPAYGQLSAAFDRVRSQAAALDRRAGPGAGDTLRRAATASLVDLLGERTPPSTLRSKVAAATDGTARRGARGRA